MGCFTACFGISKDDKKKKKKKTKTKQKVLSRDQRCGIQRPLQPVEQSLIPEKQEKEEDELSNKKRVTFDTKVKTHCPISIRESTISLDLIEIAIKDDEPDNNLLNPTISQPLPKLGSFPPNHRYMNCTESSDEEEEEEEADLNDGSDNDVVSSLEHVWCEEIPVASMELRTDEVEDSCSTKLSVAPVHTVLNNSNPLEKSSEWKVAKSQVTTSTQLNHDGLNSKDAAESMEEINSVDASLSNWLVTPLRLEMNSSEQKEEEGSSKNPMWSRRIEDRPILGVLTVEEELNKYSSSASSRSPSRSSPGNEMPMIGTFSGNYWSKLESNIDKKKSSPGSVSSFKGIPNTTSKYREDKKVNWHSTPFQKRLDRALLQI
ncbi:uncharacterized protein LOC124932725 [Impatiens glandulifera]|uniref:uncharacterized protein LOC124932725 n=1 Tax=Impatiens glandulifera TaxID=253017 RepID=UPI001FB15FED|nr:uncharacterized protein LOC124932725 [Impatiens glandulifera]